MKLLPIAAAAFLLCSPALASSKDKDDSKPTTNITANPTSNAESNAAALSGSSAEIDLNLKNTNRNTNNNHNNANALGIGVGIGEGGKGGEGGNAFSKSNAKGGDAKSNAKGGDSRSSSNSGSASSVGPIQNRQTTNIGGSNTVLNNNTIYPVQVPNLVGPAAPDSVTVLSFYGQYSEYQDGGFTGGVQLSIPIR